MPDGTRMAGPEDLHKVLAARGDQFVQTITEKLMTYAVGRPIEFNDMPGVRGIVREAATQNYTVRVHCAGRRAERCVPQARTGRSAAGVAARRRRPI